MNNQNVGKENDENRSMVEFKKSTRKYVELSIDIKMKILESLDNGGRCRKIARLYNISPGTVINIRKNRDQITNLQLCMEHCVSRKRRIRETEYNLLNTYILKYICKCQMNNKPFNDRKLRKYAKKVARKLDLKNFQASNGWLYAFQKRYHIKCKHCEMAAAAAAHNDDDTTTQ